MQYEMRQTYYATRFPRTIPEIIIVSGERSGAIQVDRSGEEIRIVDIAVLPAFRNQGIGSAVLASLIAEANRGTVRLALTVSKSNAHARRLYERLGFRVAEDLPMDLSMCRDPS